MLPRPNHPRPSALATMLAATALIVGGCSSGGTEPTSARPSPSSAPEPSTTVATAPAVAGTSIEIKGFVFQPAELQAKVGDVITVSNGDGTDHSLTAVDGSFDTGRFSSGTRTFTVTAPGRFEFRCEVHSFMPHGSIQVSG